MERTKNEAQVESRTKSPPPEGLSGNAMSAIGYLCGIVAIVALCVEPYKNDPKVRFNAVQALLVQGSSVVGFILLGIISAISTAILSFTLSAMHLYGVMGVAMGIFPIITILASLAVVAGNIYLIIASARGKTPRVPILGDLANRFAVA